VPRDVVHQLETITQRLDVLEEAVAADQEQSLHTLEAIMKSTQQSRYVDTSAVEDPRPVFPVSPHVTGTPSIRPLSSQSRSPLTGSSQHGHFVCQSVKVTRH
jgi:hypothetical protein